MPAEQATLFGECSGVAIVSCRAADLSRLLELADAERVPATPIGMTGGSRLSFSIGGRTVIDLPVSEAEAIWHTGLDRYFDRSPSGRC